MIDDLTCFFDFGARFIYSQALYIHHLFPLLSQFKNRYSKIKTPEMLALSLFHIRLVQFTSPRFDHAYFHKQYFNMNLAFFDISLK